MALLWVTASGTDPLDIQRALDKARQQHEDAHQDDSTTVTNWGPLHASDIHPREHDGWMFMENGHPGQDFYKNAPEPLTTYKHGITRTPLHLNAKGEAYTRTYRGGENHWTGPHSAQDELLTPTPCGHSSKRPDGSWASTEHMHNHYDRLRELGSEPDTSYNEDYQRERNKRLRDNGFDVIS